MRGFVFDMDDTLYKERDYRESGYRTVARHFAATCGVSEEKLYTLMAEEPMQAFERVSDLAAARGVRITVDDQLSVYRSHLPDIRLDAEAADILGHLKCLDAPMGLITDGRAWGQLNKITALGLARYFDEDTIMPTVLYATDKHSPLPFEMMERVLRSRGATVLTYIGDNPSKDFRHPNLMGWDTVMLRDTAGANIHRQHLGEWPAENRPKTVIESLETLRLL